MKLSFNPPKKPSVDAKIAILKALMEEDEQERMEQLIMFFGCTQFLGSDYILEAIIEKMERDSEDDAIDHHMKDAFAADWDLANQMYIAWRRW